MDSKYSGKQKRDNKGLSPFAMEEFRVVDSKLKCLLKDFEQRTCSKVSDDISGAIVVLGLDIVTADMSILHSSFDKKHQQLRVQLFEEEQREDSDARQNEMERLKKLLFHYNNFNEYLEGVFRNLAKDYDNFLNKMYVDAGFDPILFEELEKTLNNFRI